jgi:hypothetical protein
MMVFDLRCSSGHVFEAWFASSDDYADQKARGLVSCPVCDCDRIEKAVMAPAVAPKGNSSLAELRMMVEANCDYVGDRFAEEARARAADDREGAPRRGIYGEATIAEARDLVAEGIPVLPLPFRPKRAADA